MKNYITGASGFLGQHLVKKLKTSRSIPHKDITNFKYKKCENFYFLSAYGNMHFHEEDENIFQANVADLIHVITKLPRGFKSFVYISTSSVKLPYQTMYSRTKKASEEILLSMIEKHHLPICIIRPYSITGVGEQKKHLIPKLIESCLGNKLMNFVPSPVHDFIDVEDAVEAMINLAENQAKGIFEIGSGRAYSNKEVLDIVEKVTGKKANINVVKTLRNYDTSNWVSRNFRARSYGWLPKKSLEQSITEMVKEYKKNG